MTVSTSLVAVWYSKDSSSSRVRSRKTSAVVASRSCAAASSVSRTPMRARISATEGRRPCFGPCRTNVLSLSLMRRAPAYDRIIWSVFGRPDQINLATNSQLPHPWVGDTSRAYDRYRFEELRACAGSSRRCRRRFVRADTTTPAGSASAGGSPGRGLSWNEQVELALRRSRGSSAWTLRRGCRAWAWSAI